MYQEMNCTTTRKTPETNITLENPDLYIKVTHPKKNQIQLNKIKTHNPNSQQPFPAIFHIHCYRSSHSKSTHLQSSFPYWQASPQSPPPPPTTLPQSKYPPDTDFPHKSYQLPPQYHLPVQFSPHLIYRCICVMRTWGLIFPVCEDSVGYFQMRGEQVAKKVIWILQWKYLCKKIRGQRHWRRAEASQGG